jgi:hypothetical protein
LFRWIGFAHAVAEKRDDPVTRNPTPSRVVSGLQPRSDSAVRFSVFGSIELLWHISHGGPNQYYCGSYAVLSKLYHYLPSKPRRCATQGTG